MEKHIHHIPHLTQDLLHVLVFLTAIFKSKKHREEIAYLGDNFPSGIGKRK